MQLHLAGTDEERRRHSVARAWKSTSSASTYIIILCAYYFDRQASLRQVKSSAQSSPNDQLGQQQCSPELSELVSVVGSAHSCSTGSNGPHTTVAGTTAALAVPVHLVQEPHGLHQDRDGGSYPPSVRPSPPNQVPSPPPCKGTGLVSTLS